MKGQHGPRSRHPAQGDRLAVRSGGFSLIEVLVSVAVVTIGFTGLAALQLAGLKSSHSSYQRSQATVLAYEIADRLRANRGELGRTGTALGGAYDDVTLCSADSGIECDHDASFTGANMATNDLADWWDDLNASGLAGWFASIARNGNSFLVVVQWNDSRAKPDLADSDDTQASCLGGTIPVQAEQVCVRTQL